MHFICIFALLNLKSNIEMKTLLICCLMVFLPLGASAMLDGDNPPGGNGNPHLAPIRPLCSATFDAQSCVMYVTFIQSIDQAELSIYKNGILIETAEIVEVTGGTTLSYPLFESGSYTVDLQIGDNTYHLIVRDM